MIRFLSSIVSRHALQRAAAIRPSLLMRQAHLCSLHHKSLEDKNPKRPSAGIATLASQSTLSIEKEVESNKAGNRGQAKAESRGFGFLAGAFVTFICMNHYISHLELVTATGRWRYMVIGKELERYVSDIAFSSNIKSWVWSNRILPDDDPRTQLVDRTCNRIIRALRPSDYSLIDFEKIEWFAVVVDEPNVASMFTTGNGRIVVYSGLLKACQTEDDLALALSHEVRKQKDMIPYASNWMMLHFIPPDSSSARSTCECLSGSQYRVTDVLSNLCFQIPEHFSSRIVFEPLSLLLWWCGLPSVGKRLDHLTVSGRRSCQREYERI
jgi:hypothetical protein